MPKLRVFSAHEVCRILLEHGFVKSRQSGSHIILRKQTTDGGRTVIVPNHPEIRRGKEHYRAERAAAFPLYALRWQRYPKRGDQILNSRRSRRDEGRGLSAEKLKN